MADISTKYMGLELKSPLIAASSGLTDNVNNIKIFQRTFGITIEISVQNLFSYPIGLHQDTHCSAYLRSPFYLLPFTFYLLPYSCRSTPPLAIYSHSKLITRRLS